MSGERIITNMSIQDAVLKVCGGIPGSMKACIELLSTGSQIDPDDWAHGFSNILDLDTLNIWDENIYILWDRVCSQDSVKMISLLRANQLGQLAGIDRAAIHRAIDSRSGEEIDFDSVLQAVQTELPKFNSQQPT